MSTLVTGIGELVTNDPSRDDGPLGVIGGAALVVEHGHVVWTGPAKEAPDADTRVDVGGRAVVPGFVDSHAHLVFAGDRAAEFEARMSGARYDGGGIGTTVAATRAATDDELRGRLRDLVAEMRAQGTTTVEVKSGYGLTVDDEARSLRLAAEVTPETTFLGAHVVPAEYAGRPDEYVGARVRPDARRLRPARPVGRRLLRAGVGARVRRRPGPRGPGGRPGRGAGPAGARQPALGRTGRAARRRARRGERRPLHPPDRRRRRRPRRRDDGRDPPARRGVLDPVAVPGRPAAARRRA